MRSETVKNYVAILKWLCDHCEDGSGDFATCTNKNRLKCCSLALIEASQKTDENGVNK
jgi:hypothetical protein